jgi:anti-sigma B factor antagonist
MATTGGDGGPVRATLSTTAEGRVLTVSGELDAAGVDAMQAAAEPAFVDLAPLEIDLSAVTFMDSAGISLLVSLRNRADSRGQRLVLVQPSATARQVLDLGGVSEWFGLGGDT